jgi:alkanesulfonate monooxygenase SsuD/methylene tetrahydromethanopterin reductase-like flavin-dependent oxidoreductase (luciferase family)
MRSLPRFALRRSSEVTELKPSGRALGRDIGVYTVGEIVCRPTRAQEYFRHWTEEAADWGAVDYMLQLKGVRRESDPDRYDRMRKALVHGQSGFPMIGSPDDVAQELERISPAGFVARQRVRLTSVQLTTVEVVLPPVCM